MSGIITVPPDGPGKKVDTSELTVGSNTVERQRLVLADPTGATGLAGATAKGTQGAFGVATQRLKNAGRNQLTFHCDEIAGVTSEALATMTIWNGGSSTSANNYTVTTGKTLRITSFSVSVRSSSAAVQWAKVRIRSDPSSLTTTSSVVGSLTAAITAATSGLVNSAVEPIVDGYELPAGTIVGVSHVGQAATSLVTICVTGFEY